MFRSPRKQFYNWIQQKWCMVPRKHPKSFNAHKCLQMSLNSLAPGRRGTNFTCVFYSLILRSDILTTSSVLGKCHRWPVMISCHWFRYCCGAIRQQAITWANVDPDPCCHMASPGYNGQANGWNTILISPSSNSVVKGKLENNVCARVMNCFSAHERVIFVFISQVAKQQGK